MSSAVTEAKAAIRVLLYRSGISTAVARLRGRSRIFMLHGIGGSDFEPAAFERAVAYLKRHFRVVPLARVIHELAEPARDGAPAVALTFDDGLENHVSVAYPVLARLGVPATFFVCPGLIDAGQWLWPHEVRARLSTLESAERQELATRCGADMPSGAEAMVGALKRMACAERAAAIDAIREATPGFARSPEQARAYDLATWSQLASLDPALVTIGSHSWSHDIMVGMDPPRLHREVACSKARIEAMLGRPIDYFCYPNGDFDAAAVAAVRGEHRAAVSTREGVLDGTGSLFELPRLSMQTTLPTVAMQMARA
ncbi:MAG: polysaccharide deacetylase family protein [Xanthomonadales bacterium]|nr:polysaccharide deacetylase family protein [Xanthomonadales bacterium]